MLGDDVLGHSHFGAECNIRVFTDRFGAGVHLREIDVVKLGNRERCQPDIRDVHESVKPRAGLPHNEASEGGEIVRAGVARRNTGGGALVDDRLVRRNADGRPVGINMAVQIDQARRHQFAGGVDHAQRPCFRNLRLNRFDHAEADSDVAAAAQRLAGVEHVAAFDEQVELVVRSHCGMRAANPCSGSKRGSRGEKVTA